jgi:hypothetical protein
MVLSSKQRKKLGYVSVPRGYERDIKNGSRQLKILAIDYECVRVGSGWAGYFTWEVKERGVLKETK